MKIRNLLCAAAASMVLFASCSGDKKGDDIRTLADYDNVTTQDTLLYYFGQLRAVDYWQYAKSDSVLMSRESRDEYLKGLRAGLDAARDNDPYNQGLYVGIQLAMNMQEFSEEYGVKLNRKVVFNAIEDGLKNDSVVNAGEANSRFRQALEALNLKKEEADREAAIGTISEAAKAGKWTKLRDTLYAGIIKTPGNGTVVKTGDYVGVSVEVADTDGKEIDRRHQDRVKVGESFPGPIAEAMQTMKVGETRTFYTTAPAMFGRYISRYGLKPTQLVTFTISLMAPAAPQADEAAE